MYYKEIRHAIYKNKKYFFKKKIQSNYINKINKKKNKIKVKYYKKNKINNFNYKKKKKYINVKRLRAKRLYKKKKIILRKNILKYNNLLKKKNKIKFKIKFGKFAIIEKCFYFLQQYYRKRKHYLKMNIIQKEKNVFVTVTDYYNNVVYKGSCGMVASKRQKLSPHACQLLGIKVVEDLLERKAKRYELCLHMRPGTFNSMYKGFIKGLKSSTDLKCVGINVLLRVAYNGVRPPRAKRR